MTPVYIGLGSNLNDPLQQLRNAVKSIQALTGCAVEASSSVYRSSPLGPQDQPDFLNAALRISTTLAPMDLLDQLQRIETEQGRTRSQRWGPRTLDLDILLVGNQIINNERLKVPHPGLAQRDFVLRPLQEVLAKNQLLPNQIDLATLLAGCEDNHLLRTNQRLTD